MESKADKMNLFTESKLFCSLYGDNFLIIQYSAPLIVPEAFLYVIDLRKNAYEKEKPEFKFSADTKSSAENIDLRKA